MIDIMEIVKSLEKYGLIIKGVSKTIKNEAKEQNRGFLGMWLGTLSASLSWNLLTGKEVKAKMPGNGVIRTGAGIIRAGEGSISCDLNWSKVNFI